LLARGVFAFKQFDKSRHSGEQIFKSRIVREVKGKATSTLFKKSRLLFKPITILARKLFLLSRLLFNA